MSLKADLATIAALLVALALLYSYAQPRPLEGQAQAQAIAAQHAGKPLPDLAFQHAATLEPGSLHEEADDFVLVVMGATRCRSCQKRELQQIGRLAAESGADFLGLYLGSAGVSCSLQSALQLKTISRIGFDVVVPMEEEALARFLPDAPLPLVFHVRDRAIASVYVPGLGGEDPGDAGRYEELLAALGG